MTERTATTIRRSIRNAERIRTLEIQLKSLKALMRQAYDDAVLARK